MSNFPIQTNIPIFHHSIIPFGLHETCSIKNALISVSCRNSETLVLDRKVLKCHCEECNLPATCPPSLSPARSCLAVAGGLRRGGRVGFAFRRVSEFRVPSFGTRKRAGDVAISLIIQ